MSFDLRSVAADLETFLVETCPDAWKVVNAEKLNGKTTGLVLSYEQLDALATANSAPLPAGWIGVTFQLVLSTPETDATKAMPRASRALADLFIALDTSNQVYYDDATRTRLSTGETAYVVPVLVLARYTPTPEPEPVPEPDAEPEEA